MYLFSHILGSLSAIVYWSTLWNWPPFPLMRYLNIYWKNYIFFFWIFKCIISISVISSIRRIFIDAYVSWSSFEISLKISCAPIFKAILNYLMHFCTCMLFYDLLTTGNSLVHNWNLIINFSFLLQILCSKKVFFSLGMGGRVF